MQISAITQTPAQALEAANKLKPLDYPVPDPKVFSPAPPLRPNVQDVVDIDRTLIALRQARG